MCVHVYIAYTQTYANLVFYMLNIAAIVNLYFIATYLRGKAIATIFNRVFKLQQHIVLGKIHTLDTVKPYFVLSVIYLIKIIIDFEWIRSTPVFHGIVVFYMYLFVTMNGLMYSWFLNVEKCLSTINHDLVYTSRMTSTKLKTLIFYYLDSEEAVRLASKTIGGSYLVIGVDAVMTYIIATNTKIFKIFSSFSFQILNREFVIHVIHFIEWNFCLHIKFFVCYQNHKMNLQVTHAIFNIL